MKKTQFIELFQVIKKTITSFISIVAFLSFGIALFIGMNCGSNALKLTADNYFQDFMMYDIRVCYKYGFNDNEIEEIKKCKDIDLIEGSYQINQMFIYEGTTYQASLNSITKDINLLSDLVGRYPENNKEILVEKRWAENNDVEIGDTISFKHDSGSFHLLKNIYDRNLSSLSSPIDNPDGMNFLTNDVYKIVGFAQSPLYFSQLTSQYGSSNINSAPINVAFFLDKSAFDSDSFLGYTALYLRNNKFNEHKYYEDKYKENINIFNETIKEYILPIVDAKFNLLQESIEYCSSYVSIPEINQEQIGFFTRNSNFSFFYISLISDACNNLRYVLSFALFFIALLISLTVIKRLIAEQSVLIGTKKALGFKDREILGFFVLYTLFACLLGSILGLILSRFVISPIVLFAIRGLFTISGSAYPSNITLSILVCLFCVAFTLLTTFLSSKFSLNKDAINLLNGVDEYKTKRRFYENFKVWNKLSLFKKTMINNMLNEKKRALTTIVSVLGVISLIICGFNFSLVVSNQSKQHFKKYEKFDYVIYFESSNPSTKEEIVSILKNEEIEYSKANSFSGSLQFPDDVYQPIFVFSSNDENFSNMFNIVNVEGKECDIRNGIYMAEALAKFMDDSNEITFIESNGAETKIIIDDIIKSYSVTPFMFINKESYKTIFGIDYKDNVILLNSNNKDMSGIINSLEGIEGYLSFINFKEEELSILNNLSGSFIAVAAVFSVISIIMAFLVVMNLLYTFVVNKKKELIVLLINGYKLKDAKRYIYQDTFILSLIGIFLGCFIGTILGKLATNIINVEFLLFIPQVNWLSIILGVVLTSTFLVIISHISLKQINKFSLTDLTN